MKKSEDAMRITQLYVSPLLRKEVEVDHLRVGTRWSCVI